jgi:RNA polymerase sigma factor (sigma-70 family)
MGQAWTEPESSRSRHPHMTAERAGVPAPEGPQAPFADDLALARRALARDEAAWRAIYERTRQRLFALLAYHTGDREDALELLQDVYLHAFQGLARYRGEGPLEAWLCVMAIRRARDWKRRLFRKRRHEVDDAEIGRAMDAGAPAGADESALPLRRLLDRALAALPERQRAAFLLREVEDLSFRDVAEALGVNEATARVHHLRARRALQSLLKDEPGAADFAAEENSEGTP